MRAWWLALLLSACSREASVRYLDDPSFRREAMLRSLVSPTNSYSAQRIASYGLGDRGWDRLPEWRPRSRPLDATDADALAHGGLTTAPPPLLWDGHRPTSEREWIALGREVFFGFPLRAEPAMEWAVTQPRAERYGVQRLPDGSYPGLRVITDLDGRTRVAITCANCHANVEHGELIVGRARRDFDYGALRVAFHDAGGGRDGQELVERMKHWGPGRADVTEEDEDPVAIPDLWGLTAESALTQGGLIRQDDTPIALALRQETQYTQANRHRARPPRELAWALALYLRSLTPPPSHQAHDDVTAHGAAIFARECSGCHDNAAYGGAPIDAAIVGTDPTLARGTSRGTGRYRPAPLLDVRDGAPYLHDGSVPSLEMLLSKNRPAGHGYGTELTPPDRDALIAFLRTI
jgi:mono/diheme cytochrome c family protein